MSEDESRYKDRDNDDEGGRTVDWVAVTYFSIIINVALATSSSLSGVISSAHSRLPLPLSRPIHSGSQSYTATAASL